MDTTGAACSVALVTRGRVLAHNSVPMTRGHAEYLAPQVKSLLVDANIAPKDLSRIAVCTGPGSFTGLRVALALGKGMALPLGIDVVGISALDIWAAMADPEKTQTVWSFADVRRGEMFGSLYKNGAAQSAPKLSPITEPPKGVTAIGTAADLGRIDARILGWMGLDAAPADCPPVPLYHRAPDAKLPGGIDPT